MRSTGNKSKKQVNWSTPKFKTFAHQKAQSTEQKPTYRMKENIYKLYL